MPSSWRRCRQVHREISRQGGTQSLAGRQIFGPQNELRNVALREHLVQRQVKARHARAHPGADAGHPGFGHQALFHQARDFFVGRKRCAFREPDVHQNFRAAGVGKKLLLHFAHAHNAQGEGEHRGANGEPAVGHAPVDSAAKAHIERAVEQLVRLTFFGMRLDAQNQGAQVGHEKHRHPPTQQQRNHGHRKNREGVFTGDRFGQTDR